MVIRNQKSLCQQAKLYFYDSLSEEGCELIPESIKNHLAQCRECKEKIEQLKATLKNKDFIKSKSRQNTPAVTTMLELHFAYIGEYVTCKTVRPFLPGLLDPTIDIRIPTPITVHLDNCRHCKEDLNKIRQMNLSSTQLYRLSQFFADKNKQQTTEYSEMAPAFKEMASRADSEITTIYHVDESAKNKQARNSDGLYSGFPINVEVLEPKPEVEQPVVSIDFAAALKKKIAAMNLRPLLKVGLAAAAVIMIGFFLFPNTNPVEAEGVEEMIKALGEAGNIYISTFYINELTQEPKLTQERWISHTLNTFINKNEEEIVLVNIKTGTEQIKNLNTNVIEPRKLTGDSSINVKQAMIEALGLTPFNNTSVLPPDSEWVRKDTLSQATQGIEVYDLDYRLSTSRYSHKLRCSVDSETFFPEEIKYYRTPTGQAQSEDDLKMLYKIRRVNESDILEVIQNEGFKI